MQYYMKLQWWIQETFLTLAPDERLPILMLQIKMAYTIVIYSLCKNKVNVTFILQQAMKAQRGNRGVALFFL
jgi:hypothetical protein